VGFGNIIKVTFMVDWAAVNVFYNTDRIDGLEKKKSQKKDKTVTKR
jgi:hypothetical protein